jgi:hypothetical protein
MQQPGYVFIVGLPRTGTTLTRAILNRSAEVSIAMGESHFLGSLKRPGFWRELTAVGDIKTDEGARAVVEHIYRQQDTFWVPITSKVGRDEFLRQLLNSERNDRALFELAIRLAAEGKPIPGEKSPGHIFAVPTLLEWFPTAKIIHTFRDPRAIYVSQRRKQTQKGKARRSKSFGELYASSGFVVAWRRIVELHHRYQRQYPGRYCLSRYEDIVKDPRSSVRRLCDFLAIDFADAMLEQQVSINSSFLPHEQVPGFDTQAVDRWKQHIHPLAQGWLTFCLKKQLREFGYQA